MKQMYFILWHIAYESYDYPFFDHACVVGFLKVKSSVVWLFCNKCVGFFFFKLTLSIVRGYVQFHLLLSC